MTTTISPDSRWTRRRSEKQRRLGLVKGLADGVVLPTDKIVAALEALILPGDRVVLEGNNQKQADFLSRSLAKVDPSKLHDLHMIMPSVGRSEHLDLFERGIARKLDFSFAGTQSLRISQLLEPDLDAPWHARYAWWSVYPLGWDKPKGGPSGVLKELQRPLVGELFWAVAEELAVTRVVLVSGVSAWPELKDVLGLGDLSPGSKPVLAGGRVRGVTVVATFNPGARLGISRDSFARSVAAAVKAAGS